LKKSFYLFITGILLLFWNQKGGSQDLQTFGPAVHEDSSQVISTRSICVPSPSVDIKYNFHLSFEENVNRAIRKERINFKQPDIGNYQHPDYYQDPVEYSHKIISALRLAYSKAYNIKVVDIPLDVAVNNAAQNHSCRMISCNEFAHQSRCTGSPQSRLAEQIGAMGICIRGFSENIAINTSPSVERAIEWAIFSMMYDDQACCQNGHRENFLKCSYDDSWRMGFGFQKGKFNFSGGRKSDTWFLTWNFAKIGRISGCSWGEGKEMKNCPGEADIEFQTMSLTGQNNCRQLKLTWSMNNAKDLRDFEVFLRQDTREYKSAGKIAYDQRKKTYAAIFPARGKVVDVYVKAHLRTGSFRNSELSSFDLNDCSEIATPEQEKDQPSKDENPLAELGQPKKSGKKASDEIVVVPNPARNEIELKNIPHGSTYAIYFINGQLAMWGKYNRKISLQWLRSGRYVVVVNGKSAQFVKM